MGRGSRTGNSKATKMPPSRGKKTSPDEDEKNASSSKATKRIKTETPTSASSRGGHDSSNAIDLESGVQLVFSDDEDEPKVVAKSSGSKRKGTGKKKKESDVEEDQEDDDAPEEVSMASQRAATEIQQAKEKAARERVLQEKQAKSEIEAARQAKREAQKAAKLARQEQQQASQSQPEEEQLISSQSQPDFLPADLLNALGQNVTSPRAPQRVRTAEAAKKEAVDRRLSQIWEETGIQVAVVKKPVEVTLPKAMVDFMEECKAAIPRTPVAEKKKRMKRTIKTVM